MDTFSLDNIRLTKYIFFTGKGGVGKTSLACATAIGLADRGKRILLVSTDPASNLQDVFRSDFNGYGMPVPEVHGLMVANINPEEAAAAYRESVIGPFRGKLPDSVIAGMEEQLSGSCTVEIAAFNSFCDFMTDAGKEEQYDHILFDTAPTGHTLRMLRLPSAWSTFISHSTHGASCLGQLSGLEERKEIYRQAMDKLADNAETLLMLVSRPDLSSLKEAERSSGELRATGISNRLCVINGILDKGNVTEPVSEAIFKAQQEALAHLPAGLQSIPLLTVPLRSYNLSSVADIRRMLSEDEIRDDMDFRHPEPSGKSIDDVVRDLMITGKRVIFTMGKGGVGKTTVATEIAVKLADAGVRVHLTTTDPANHLDYGNALHRGITMSRIDEKDVLERYRREVLSKAAETMRTEDLSYIEEDLRSPCTQEIAVFRAFADIVEKADDEVVIIDTAPTGHTLLLLDATESYHKEVERTHGNMPPSVRHLLPRLKNSAETEVIIVTLPEATPVFEAGRLRQDLRRAGIPQKWWVVNSCLALTHTTNNFLCMKASEECRWIKKVKELSDNNMALVAWKNK